MGMYVQYNSSHCDVDYLQGLSETLFEWRKWPWKGRAYCCVSTGTTLHGQSCVLGCATIVHVPNKMFHSKVFEKCMLGL